jgi:hypothetical protein
VALDSGLPALLRSVSVRIKERGRREERSAGSVGDGDDLPTVGISFEVYKIFAVNNTSGLHMEIQCDTRHSLIVRTTLKTGRELAVWPPSSFSSCWSYSANVFTDSLAFTCTIL